MKKLTCFLIALSICLCLFVLPASAANEYRTWLQSDSRWGSIQFGTSDTMSKSGCAITSIAKLMVHSGAVSSDESVFNPGIFCNWLKGTGGITSQGWIVWAAPGKYTSKFSYSGAVALAGTQAQKTATIKSYVDDGHVVVAMVKNGGHYVAVDKVSDGTVYIMDPARTGYTKLFQYDAAGVTKIQIYKGVHNGSGGNTNPPAYDTSVQPVGVGTYTITSKPDGVNLRAGAGTSYNVLTAIPYQTKVQVTKVQDGWGYTKYDGKTGWFSLTYAQMTPVNLRGLQVKAPQKLTYLVGEEFDPAGMTVTALYGDGSSKTVKSGYTVSGFSSKKEGTCKVYVTYQSKSAVFTVAVKKEAIVYQPGSYVVDSDDGVNLRTQPSTESKVLTAMPDKTRLEVAEIRENWGKTTYGSYTGWVCLDYTAATTAAQTGITAVAKKTCILTGDTVTKEDLIVKRVYKDGSFVTVTDFTFTLGKVKENVLPITITEGGYTTTVEIKVFDEIPKGDCNFDGVVNAEDALVALQYAVGKVDEDEFYPSAADVNADEVIDASDALTILRFAVGKLDRL